MPGGTKDLNTPQLTGRRRYRSMSDRMGWQGALVLEVEEAVYTEVSGVRGWEMRWRFATPEDVTETVI
jgi:hypothetical protein